MTLQKLEIRKYFTLLPESVKCFDYFSLLPKRNTFRETQKTNILKLEEANFF